MLAVIRIRGEVHLSQEIKDTLSMLRLNRVNHCVVINETLNMTGMLRKTKDYITWGEIDDKTLEKLVAKRGRLVGDKKIEEKMSKEVVKEILKNKSTKNVKDLKPVFRLSPPSKGYKSVRSSYPRGSLGYRGDNINILLNKMI
ncbi:MAG: 50S ribosomal protein L30 [Candidatus Aenigmatarchaeota archaeon]